MLNAAAHEPQMLQARVKLQQFGVTAPVDLLRKGEDTRRTDSQAPW